MAPEYFLSPSYLSVNIPVRFLHDNHASHQILLGTERRKLKLHVPVAFVSSQLRMKLTKLEAPCVQQKDTLINNSGGFVTLKREKMTINQITIAPLYQIANV